MIQIEGELYVTRHLYTFELPRPLPSEVFVFDYFFFSPTWNVWFWESEPKLEFIHLFIYLFIKEMDKFNNALIISLFYLFISFH
jgi:hypothetical protein